MHVPTHEVGSLGRQVKSTLRELTVTIICSAACLLGSSSSLPKAAAASRLTCSQETSCKCLTYRSSPDRSMLSCSDCSRWRKHWEARDECSQLHWLNLYLGKHVWPTSKLVQGPGQHGCTGLMARQEEGLHFVAQLCLQGRAPCVALCLHFRKGRSAQTVPS